MIKNKFLYEFNDRFNHLLEHDGTHPCDIERKSLFYIIAGNDDLYRKVNSIYDFKDRSINADCLENGQADFCSSSSKLIKLAFNLYNGYSSDVLDIFSSLDENNFNLALSALMLRFIDSCETQLRKKSKEI